MKIKAKLKILFIIPILICSYLYSEQITLNFAYQNTNNYPFQTENSNNINWEKPGATIEMFEILEKKLNIKIKYKRVPWKRGLYELQEGIIDGLIDASYTKNRLEYGLFPTKNKILDETKNMHYNTYYLYTKRNSKLFWDGKNLYNLNKKICAERGYSIVYDLNKIGVETYETRSTLKCMEMLDRDLVDGVASLEFASDSIINQEKLKFLNIIKIQPAIQKKAYYLMLSYQFVEKNPQLANDIWSTLVEIRDSNEMKKIYKKY